MKNMRPNIHTEFILSSINSNLIDVVSASDRLGIGIEAYPICDYLMQSVFLKMTGYQEQKLKCLCWELATIDFEYRYDYNTKPIGERSSYNDKQALYKDLIDQIKKRITSFDPSLYLNKKAILEKVTDGIKTIFENTNLSIWAQKDFDEYKLIWAEVKEMHFANDSSNLFTSTNPGQMSLQRIYKDHLYKHRNRIAHNTQSYQQNSPTLNALFTMDYQYKNYFIWFSTLMLIDEVFVSLYEKYLSTFNEI